MLKVAILFVVASCFAMANAQCNFTTNNANGYHGATLQEWKDCVAAVPYNATARSQMDAAIAAWLDLYSFADISSNSGAPYNISVGDDPFGSGSINATYSSMPAYFEAILKEANKFRDAHFQFTMPAPFSQSFLLTPFCLQSTLASNGTLVFKTLGFFSGTPGASVFDAIDPVSNATSYVGKTLVTIDGVSTLQFLKNWLDGGDLGQFRDPSIRFNGALGSDGYWCGRSLGAFPWSTIPDSHTYAFDDGTSVNIANKIITLRVANASAFAASMYNSASRKRSVDPSGLPKEMTPLDTMYERTPPDWDHEERLAMAHKLAFRRVPPQFYHTKFAQSLGYSQKKRDLSSSSSIANVFTWITGNSGYGIGAWQLNVPNVGVLKITDFTADRGQTGAKLDAIAAGIKGIAQLGITNLIIDVTGNAGGLTAAAYNTLMWLTPEWELANFSKASSPVPPVSFRITNTTDAMNTAGALPPIFLSHITGKLENASNYYVANRRNNVPRGDLFSAMTDISFLDVSSQLDSGAYIAWGGSSGVSPLSAAYYFDKIIVVSDGLCASACGQFIKHLRVHDRARTIFVGGFPGVDSDVASYPGGAKFAYTDFSQTTYALPFLPAGVLSFNWIETYSDCSNITPFDLGRVSYDAQYTSWDVIHQDVADDNTVGRDNSVALYQWVSNWFAKMPSGLPKFNRDRPANATDVCPTIGQLVPTPTPFSNDCYGAWNDVNDCSVLCDGGYKTQRYTIYITGASNGTACPFSDGAIQNVSCNTQACVNCNSVTKDYGVCQSDCQKQTIYRVNTGQCPYDNGTILEADCFTGMCEPAAPDGKRGAILPFLHCVQTGNPYTAYFGYFNPNNRSISVPPSGVLDDSSTNNIFVGTKNRGQPTDFLAGYQPFAFAITFTETSTLAWMIDGTNLTFSSSLQIFACPAATGSSSLRIMVEGTNAPTQSQLNDMITLINSDTGLDTGRLSGNITINPAGTENMFQIYLNILSGISVSITNPAALEKVADLIRSQPTNYFLALGGRLTPPFDFGNVSVEVNWHGTITNPISGNVTNINYIDDDQIVPSPPAPVPVAPPPSTASQLAMSAVVIFAAMFMFFSF